MIVKPQADGTVEVVPSTDTFEVERLINVLRSNGFRVVRLGEKNGSISLQVREIKVPKLLAS
jgi:acylphosphatase